MRRMISGPTWALLAGAVVLAGTADAEGRFKGGKIHLVQASHHDLGWHKGTYGAEMRFTFQEIDKALDLMKADPKFTFTGEYTVWLHEYLSRRPARVAELKKRFEEGRMEWGAGFSMPYTSLVTNEQLARQMYYGRKWFNKELPSRASIYFNTDVPGFGMQMPQILRKSGVDKVFLSRSWNLSNIDTDFLTWIAPDGSDVFCYFMHHYGNHVGAYRKKKMGDNVQMTKWIESRENSYTARRIPPHLIHFLCMDCRLPSPYRGSIDAWNEHAGRNGLPRMAYSTLGKAMDAVRGKEAEFKSITGEWPNKWVYEAAPSNYEIISDQRGSDRLLTAAEAFSAFRALLEGGFDRYPSRKLEGAWKQGIFSCHGFAPDAVIELYAKQYRAARDSGEQMLQDALQAIARRVKTNARGLPLVVYNTLSWDRTDIVEMQVPEGAPPLLRIVDSRGTTVPHQITRDKRVVFRADGVPSFGYKTYYLAKAGKQQAVQTKHKPGAAWDGAFENEFFIIEPASGGLQRIYDKALDRELLKTDKFLGAEWLDYEYKGQGAGEHTHITMPTAHRFDRLRKYGTSWVCAESGPVRTAFETAPVKTPRGKVRLRLTAYASLKRIDLECRILDTDQAEARQMRLALPLNADPRQVAYEVPFGVVEVGRSELEPALAFGPASVRPREIQNWIYAGGEKGGVTIGSGVAVWDYAEVSPRRPPRSKYPILQPVLLTSAYSCSRWKKCWVQPGDHSFRFSMYSHKPGWRHGYRKGVQSNNPLIAVVQAGRSESAKLPEVKSFLSISPANVIVTAVKRSEEGNDVVVRFYEVEGKSGSRVRISPDARLSGARRTNLIEEDAGVLEHDRNGAALKVGPFSIETVRLRPSVGAGEKAD